MNREAYERVMEEYRLQREKNNAEEDRRKEEIREKNPALFDLVTQRHHLVLGSIQNILLGQGEDNQDLESKMADYNARIREGLVQNGYAPNYLEPVCRCAKCGDTGYVGEPVREMCTCLKAALSRENNAGHNAETFEDYNADFFPDTPLKEMPQRTQRAYMRATRKACETFADRYPEGSVRNLLLHGSSGLGKTHLARCVANRLTDRGFNVRFVTAYQLLSDLRQDYFRPEGVTEEYLNADFLVIDDLGIEPLFDKITVEMILNVLNERLLRGKGTAISTNLSRRELQERYTERFSSRFLSPANCLDLAFIGEDMRLHGERG